MTETIYRLHIAEDQDLLDLANLVYVLPQLLEKAGLGAWGKEQVQRNLSAAELQRGATQLENVWARSHATTREAVLTEERTLYQGEFNAHLQHHLRVFQAGQRTQGQSLWWLRKEIRESYERQFMLGLEAAGKVREPTSAEARYLRWLRYQDFDYLRKFLDDVVNGRGQMDYRRRMAMYAAGGEQAYWAGWVFGQDPKKCIRWVMNEAEHCETCLHLVAGGPWKNGIYQRADFLRMRVFPKSDRLACYRGCKCHLEVVPKPSRRPPWKAPKGKVKRKE